MSYTASTPITSERELVKEFERQDNSAVLENLAAGHPVVFREPNTPAGHVIRKYPDGRRELLRYERGTPIVVKDLGAE
ncbi:hypothetical protein GSG79_004268 [Escherichia coli]|nr:hypothetical protein [Escherichia coli]